MSQAVRDILRALEEYEDSAASVGLDLRLSLTQIILRNLRRRDWSQRELASCTGLKESYISRVLHSNANCTLDTAGKFLYALGIRAAFHEVQKTETSLIAHGATNTVLKFPAQPEYTDDKEAAQETKATDLNIIYA